MLGLVRHSRARGRPGSDECATLSSMKPAEAVPTPAPSEPELEVVNTDGDDLTDDERAELHKALKAGYAQAKAGLVVPGEEVLRKLRSAR